MKINNWATVEGVGQVITTGAFVVLTESFPSTGSIAITVFALPATPTGPKRWVLKRRYFRVASAIAGSGSPTCTARLGSTSGGQEVLLDAIVTGSNSAGDIVAGEAQSSLGTDLAAANNYEHIYSAGQAFTLTLTKGGSTVTGGSLTTYLEFGALP